MGSHFEVGDLSLEFVSEFRVGGRGEVRSEMLSLACVRVAFEVVVVVRVVVGSTPRGALGAGGDVLPEQRLAEAHAHELPVQHHLKKHTMCGFQ